MSDERLEAYLCKQGGLLRWKAGGDEEVVQEARIAVWQALQRHPEATTSYLDQAAKWRIAAVQRGEGLTGEQRPKGGRVDALRTELAPVEDAAELPAADATESADYAAHRGEIASAVESLSPAHRDYVIARFWRDMDRNEIGQRLGRNPGNLATTWRTQIRPALAESLAHLRDAA